MRAVAGRGSPRPAGRLLLRRGLAVVAIRGDGTTFPDNPPAFGGSMFSAEEP